MPQLHRESVLVKPINTPITPLCSECPLPQLQIFEHPEFLNTFYYAKLNLPHGSHMSRAWPAHVENLANILLQRV
jgi:hypothetical protein